MFTVKYDRLNEPRELFRARTGRGGRVRFGANQNMVTDGNRITSIEIAIDTAALVLHPDDTSGVATMAHEGSHATAIAAGEASGLNPWRAWNEGVKGDDPTSDTGSAAAEGREVFQEEPDLTSEEAEAFLEELEKSSEE